MWCWRRRYRGRRPATDIVRILFGETSPRPSRVRSRMMPPPRSSSSARASRSCSPQSQRREPNSRQSGRRNAAARGTALVKSGVPTMTATGLHLWMDARHEPAELVLHNDKRHNQPVKCFRGGSKVGCLAMSCLNSSTWLGIRLGRNSNAICQRSPLADLMDSFLGVSDLHPCFSHGH